MAKYISVYIVIFFLITVFPFSFFKTIPRIFTVLSGSMEPNIKSGSLVVTKNVASKDIKVGDIVAFISPNNPKDVILHRVYSIKSLKPLRFSTKGDNNNTVDQWDVVDVGILGLYQFSIPFLGNISAFVRTPFGFLLTICFPAIYVIFLEILSIKKKINSKIRWHISKKDQKKSIKITIIFIFFITNVLISPSKKVLAFYSSTTLVPGLTFSIGELSPPESTINIGDTQILNIRDFNIYVFANDNVSVSKIQLYYSYNFNNWQLFPETLYTDSGNFHFTSPEGDGLYSFESIATDSSGNIEVKEFNYFNNQIKVDTIAPTTNLAKKPEINHVYDGQNYLINGSFEDGMNSWVVGSSIGDHHIISIGETNNVFMLGSDTQTINGTDSVFQTVSLPEFSSTTLSFSYRFLSHDIADYDRFSVDITDLSGTKTLENILNFGNLNSDDFDYDSGWITLTRSLNNLAGQTFKLLFSLTDTGVGDDYNSWVYLDDIKISTLDTRIGDTSILDYYVTDLGSDIAATTPPPILEIGENILSFSSTDSAQNTENIIHQSVLVLSPVVLTKIDKDIITIYNNSQDQNIDLASYSYSINGANVIFLSGTLVPQQSSNIFIASTLPDISEIKLFENGNTVDSVSITNASTSTWQRISNGLGSWIKNTIPPSFNLESRLSVSKITLSVSGLSSTLPDMSYTIDYTDISGPQQIYGQILAGTIDSQGMSSRDFYLGTCSGGGTCVSAVGLGTSFVVTFSNLLPQTFIFN